MGPEPGKVLELLTKAIDAGASDLHLVSGVLPVMRVHGDLVELNESSLEPEELREGLEGLCPALVLEAFRASKNADFSLNLQIRQTAHRFRVNYFMAGQRMGACFRLIPHAIPSFEWAGFPRSLGERIARLPNGLVLVSGVTGSGKTTTLALIIDLIKRTGGYRIITVEEPVEYLFTRSGRSLVTQREVGVDVMTFADGLKYGLRQDPDIILVGEIRDRETAQMALSAAETGHLVLSTMHTRDAKGAISRFADLFPQDAQSDIRSQLAMSLRVVVCQHLIASIVPGEKRELAIEVLINTLPVASAIRSGKISSIDNNIVTGRSEGMLTMNDSVARLYHAGRISRESAERLVTDGSYLNGR